MKNVKIRHDDHGLGDDHIKFVNHVVANEPDGFFIKLLVLPPECSDLMSALHGPTAGDDPVNEDEVTYVVRNGRPGPSRLVDRPERPCRNIVIIGMGGGKPVVITAYGTQSPFPSPREWWDSGMRPREAVDAAVFWMEHALSGRPASLGTEVSNA